ncbi:MAG: hypothetical protein K0R59_3906, partial [Sphingobacterium sp.]|nr:hypothetical protein [Sphingobacterium sp.]MDF2518610.1 hypothetical protein [Sphingobacterium sp.]
MIENSEPRTLSFDNTEIAFKSKS